MSLGLQKYLWSGRDVWEEGQNWGGHTGKRGGRVQKIATWNGFVLSCQQGLVIQQTSLNLQSATTQRNATRQRCSLQPWGFWRRARQRSFKPDSVTQEEKGKESERDTDSNQFWQFLASGEKGGWKEGDEGHTADTSYWGVPSLGKGGGQLLPCDLCWMRCTWTLPSTTCGWVQQEGESTCQMGPLVCIKGAIWI